MLGLRFKILFGLGGLLAILIAVSLLGETVLDRYSAAMQRSFREDYDSVAVCQRMKQTIEQLNSAIEDSLYGTTHAYHQTRELEQNFEQNLELQRRDATLAGEKEATDRLASWWEQYRSGYRSALDSAATPSSRQQIYSTRIYPLSREIETAAQTLIDMNMESVLSVHGKVSAMAARANNVMRWLSISGLALAIVFAAMIGRFVLAPLKLLTASVQQIERGNLNLAVPVRSHDELGVLAAAFNAMAAQLRVYRQREHDRLVRTEHSTQLTIDSLPDAVVILTPAGRIEMTNEVARRLFGIEPGTLIQADGRAELAELHRRAVQDEKLAELQGYDSTIQLTVGGEPRYFLPRGVPILDEDKRLIGATLILADVSGLRRLDEMKNGLLSLVSHELKTPLTSMRMILHLLADGKVGELAERQKELLETAREDSDRLHQIVESLLDMSRIEAGKALMELQPVRPGRLATVAAETFGSAFAAQETALVVQVKAELPDVLADATRVNYIFANLLNNALRHTSVGNRVFITARATEQFVEFEIADDGVGIPPQHVPRIFEKFYRVPGQSSSNGAGLGLAIVREIVEAHGGQVRVESSVGSGAIFGFTLRRADSMHASGQAR